MIEIELYINIHIWLYYHRTTEYIRFLGVYILIYTIERLFSSLQNPQRALSSLDRKGKKKSSQKGPVMYTTRATPLSSNWFRLLSFFFSHIYYLYILSRPSRINAMLDRLRRGRGGIVISGQGGSAKDLLANEAKKGPRVLLRGYTRWCFLAASIYGYAEIGF